MPPDQLVSRAIFDAVLAISDNAKYQIVPAATLERRDAAGQ